MSSSFLSVRQHTSGGKVSKRNEQALESKQVERGIAPQPVFLLGDNALESTIRSTRGIGGIEERQKSYSSVLSFSSWALPF